MSHIKGIKNFAVVVMAVAAMSSLNACNGDSVSANSGTYSSKIGIAKGGESQDEYLGPLMEELFASKTVGEMQVASEQLMCFADKNRSWGINDPGQAILTYKKWHPDVDSTPLDKALSVLAVLPHNSEQYKEYDAWIEAATKAYMEKASNGGEDEGFMCTLYEYHISHAPLSF